MTKPLIEATFKEETQSITWLMRNEKVTAGSDWSYKWKKNWLLNFKDSGSVTASVQGVSMMLDLFLKYDVSTKKFIIETTHCQSSIDNIDLDFGGDSSIVYSIITKWFFTLKTFLFKIISRFWRFYSNVQSNFTYTTWRKLFKTTD